LVADFEAVDDVYEQLDDGMCDVRVVGELMEGHNFFDVDGLLNKDMEFCEVL
jgi:hypothetical protein